MFKKFFIAVLRLTEVISLLEILIHPFLLLVFVGTMIIDDFMVPTRKNRTINLTVDGISRALVRLMCILSFICLPVIPIMVIPLVMFIIADSNWDCNKKLK